MRFFAAAALAVLVLAGGCTPVSLLPPSLSAAEIDASRAHSSNAAGLLVPLYVYPGRQWNAVIGAKLRYPPVRMVIIANVNNGPGNSVDPNYAAFIAKAQKAGIGIVGYVYTQYGRRSATQLDADIAKWGAYYHTNGVFLDQMATKSPSYYQAATAYAHAHSLPIVLGNPGVNAPGSSGPDVINFYEKAGYPSVSFLAQPAHTKYGSSRWSYIAGAVPFSAAKIRATAQFVNYLFATDGKEPACYCRLPSYFDRLVATLSSL